ncbi:MAG TPA: hypothetical protein VK066_00460 [Chloroflexota bacterium]|nr:hypothetical protein [Chloroflexota bacterium]
MAFLKGLFGSKGLPPEERAAIEQYLAAADPLLRQLESEYRQWLERVGVTRGTDVGGINDPQGEHSGVFVWRTIETERTFAQLEPPRRASGMHNSYVDCVEARHNAAKTIYDALQVADVRPPQSALQDATRILAEAESLRKQGDRQRDKLERLLG